MHAYQEGKFCFDEISRVFSSKSISFTKKKLKVVGLLRSIKIQITIYLKQYKNKFVFAIKKLTKHAIEDIIVFFMGYICH
jgi:hypothetical protein